MAKWWNKLNNLDKIEGNDYSKLYVKSKNAFFYINREGSADELIVLKPFLTELAYDLKVTTEPNGNSITNSNPSQVIKESTIDLKVALDVPATSVSEAKANRKKISKLMTWLRDPTKVPVKVGSTKAENCDPIIKKWTNAGYSFSTSKAEIVHKVAGKVSRFKNKRPKEYQQLKACMIKAAKANISGPPASGAKTATNTAYSGENMVFRINFANLIQNGKYRKEHEILSTSRTQTDANLAAYALRCFLSNVTADIDLDMGFFEGLNEEKKVILIPKSYKLSFDVSILNRFESGPDRNILGFYTAGTEKANKYREKDNYHQHDSRYWPFGVSSSSWGGGETTTGTMERNYTDKTNSLIRFKKFGQRVAFLPLINKLSVVRKIDSSGIQEIKHLTGVDRIVYDTKMPIFSLSFTVAAISVNHSKRTLYNFQKLMRMIYPNYVPGSTSFSYLFVQLGNLIGTGTEFFNSKDYVKCICSSLSLKPDLEFGFFEEKGMLYPKNFNVSLTLEVNDHGFGA